MLCNRDMGGFDKLEDLREQMLEVTSTEQYHQEAIASAKNELSKVTAKYDRKKVYSSPQKLEYLEAEIRLIKNVLQHHEEAITFVRVELNRIRVSYADNQFALKMHQWN